MASLKHGDVKFFEGLMWTFGISKIPTLSMPNFLFKYVFTLILSIGEQSSQKKKKHFTSHVKCDMREAMPKSIQKDIPLYLLFAYDNYLGR